MFCQKKVHWRTDALFSVHAVSECTCVAQTIVCSQGADFHSDNMNEFKCGWNSFICIEKEGKKKILTAGEGGEKIKGGKVRRNRNFQNSSKEQLVWNWRSAGKVQQLNKLKDIWHSFYYHQWNSLVKAVCFITQTGSSCELDRVDELD